MTDDMAELERLLDVPIVFGLVAQGHIPTVERMLAEGKTWDEIGAEIGWLPETSREHYERYRERKGGAS